MPYLGTVNAVANTVKNVASVVHREDSTGIKGIYSQSGFSALNNIGDFMTQTIKINKIPILIGLWKKSLLNSDIDLSPRQVQNIIDSFDEYELSVMNKPSLIMKQSINYKNHDGTQTYIVYSFQPSRDKEEMIYTTFRTVTNFKVAQKYAIMNRSKCNIIRCKSVDYIQYIDTPIDEGHWDTIMRMNVNFIRTAQLLIGPSLDQLYISSENY